MNAVELGVSVGTIAVAGAVLVYVRKVRNRLRRFVLRNDEVSDYYKD